MANLHAAVSDCVCLTWHGSIVLQGLVEFHEGGVVSQPRVAGLDGRHERVQLQVRLVMCDHGLRHLRDLDP